MEASNQTNKQVLPTYIPYKDPVYNNNNKYEPSSAYASQPKMEPKPQKKSGPTTHEAEICCLGLYCLCCILDIATDVSKK